MLMHAYAIPRVSPRQPFSTYHVGVPLSEYRPAFKLGIPVLMFWWFSVSVEAFTYKTSPVLRLVDQIPAAFWGLAGVSVILGLTYGMFTRSAETVRLALVGAFFFSSVRSILIAINWYIDWRNGDPISYTTVPSTMVITTSQYILAKTGLRLPTQDRLLGE